MTTWMETGNVSASRDSFTLGGSVQAACVAMEKDWKRGGVK